MYGLDIELLNSLNMGNLVKENLKKRDEETKEEKSEDSNMNMD